jgi:transportin-1
LKTVYDTNKKVQEAGCSAFATLEEQAGILLIPYLKPILEHLRVGFDRFQHKNLLILYDAILTLADSVGSALNQPEYISLLIPPLLTKWERIGDEDRGLVSLLEVPPKKTIRFADLQCLSSVAVAVGPGFQPFAVAVYKHTHALIHTIVVQDHAYQTGAPTEPPDKEFLVAALDLMSGLVQGMNEDMSHIIQSTEPQLVEMLVACLADEIDDVRQSGFALMGDLTISCFPLVRPFSADLMRLLIPQITTESGAPSVCNNAAWAAGELAIQLGAHFQPFVPSLLPQLINLMNANQTPGPVVENAAIALGRMGLVAPEMVAPQLATFAATFIGSLKDVRDNEEKDSAFRGFCTMVGINPSGLTAELTNFVIAVAKYSEPSEELAQLFNTV